MYAQIAVGLSGIMLGGVTIFNPGTGKGMDHGRKHRLGNRALD